MSYLAGLTLPHRALLVELVRGVDQVNAVLFLPHFFVLSGLRTQLGLISAPMLRLVCLLILLVA
jgi:Kef-type K+ transport system membrane component KefB